MRKRFKKFVAIALTGLMVMSIGTPAFANTDTTAAVVSQKEIVAIVVENGIATPFSEQEYNEYLAEQGRNITFGELQNIRAFSSESTVNENLITIENSSEENLVTPCSSTIRMYDETSGTESIRYNLAQAVTPLLNGNLNGSVVSFGESVTITESLTGSVTLNVSQKNAIVSNLGASYSRTASSNVQFGGSMNIAAGKRARVMFAPNMRATTGILTEIFSYNSGDSKTTTINVSGLVPIKVGSFADGEYYLKYE